MTRTEPEREVKAKAASKEWSTNDFNAINELNGMLNNRYYTVGPKKLIQDVGTAITMLCMFYCEDFTLYDLRFKLQVGFDIIDERPSRLPIKDPQRFTGYIIRREHLSSLAANVHGFPEGQRELVRQFYHELGIGFDSHDSEAPHHAYLLAGQSSNVKPEVEDDEDIESVMTEDPDVPPRSSSVLSVGSSTDEPPAKKVKCSSHLRSDTSSDSSSQFEPPSPSKPSSQVSEPQSHEHGSFRESSINENGSHSAVEDPKDAITAQLEIENRSLRDQNDYLLQSGLAWKRERDECERRGLELIDKQRLY